MSDIEVFTRRTGMTTKQTQLTRQQMLGALAWVERLARDEDELREILAMLCAPGKPARRAV